ncbi:phosphate transport system regulatory protein PhoU [Thiocapsa imhoffii]|uniref:Phosphate transport system regulatory protein PhoU n=1 Tax=Thiocapsa imhoffii TaxID=382777 RepID=A0A9X1BB44_9GAMM|nr:phosphate signaling complex protein PhoU [Thiocapsa imhoffii]MBK1646371.1 phosphate transport system regulatory protein PhoU [Thiocapsa imhoffii]
MSSLPASPRQDDLAAGHTVRRYDRELKTLRDIILDMGHRVIEQVQAAVVALIDGEEIQAYRVLDREPRIDYLSLDADEEIFRVIARRQPTAVDLRIVLALSRIAGDVERAGDKAVRIARQALALRDQVSAVDNLLDDDLQSRFRQLDHRACCMFERSIEAVASFDVERALGVFEDEPELFGTSDALRAYLSREDLKGFKPYQVVCLLTSAHAIERIGNHASNIAEQVIYVAEGKDIRYRNREILIETLRRKASA